MELNIKKPYALFLGDASDELAAKVAFGIFQWRPEQCVGQIRLPACQPKLPLIQMDINDAIKSGARTLIIGVANRGGKIPIAWHETLIEAAKSGMDIASGLHHSLYDVPNLESVSKTSGILLHDVRKPKMQFRVADGLPRSGRRLLTVGTDCSVGKMYTALAIEAEAKKRNIRADFRATGQTGILIQGSGVAIDAVVSDFISGAVEELCPAAEEDHWDLIEGQGSLFHPSFAGVSLGLLHGAQPTDLVMCHEPTRQHMRGLSEYSLPSIEDCIDENLRAARLVNSSVRFVGISINTSLLDDNKYKELLNNIHHQHSLPTVDPVRDSVEPIVDEMLR